MSGLFLSRARLRRGPGASALLPLLMPVGGGPPAGHHLVWSLFADDAERRRDFLWRETEPGSFLLLSARPPQDRHGIFALDPPKPFEPALREGQRLRFDLRANATVSAARGATQRGKREGLLAQRLRAVAPADRPAAAQAASLEWLAGQGARHGFRVDAAAFALVGEDTWSILRGQRAEARIAAIDVAGVLEVTDAAAFTARLPLGFGHARAFGCGLMLIRRA